jgi:hypothetical protein
MNSENSTTRHIDAIKIITTGTIRFIVPAIIVCILTPVVYRMLTYQASSEYVDAKSDISLEQ